MPGISRAQRCAVFDAETWRFDGPLPINSFHLCDLRRPFGPQRIILAFPQNVNRTRLSQIQLKIFPAFTHLRLAVNLLKWYTGFSAAFGGKHENKGKEAVSC